MFFYQPTKGYGEYAGLKIDVAKDNFDPSFIFAYLSSVRKTVLFCGILVVSFITTEVFYCLT